MTDVLLPRKKKKKSLQGFGTATDPPVDPEATKQAVLEAIKIGYGHFDCGTEQPLGKAII